MAGLFFTFSICVMRALSLVPVGSAIQTMQQINVVILNPWFACVFFGTAVGSLVLLISGLSAGITAAWSMIAGALFYLAGGIGVTLVFNVPLNNQLADLEVSAEASELFWSRYLRRWTFWNHLRTIACTLSLVLFILSVSDSLF